MGIYGLTVFRIIYPALRWFGWAAVLFYVLMTLALLGTRYLLFPRADHYTPAIEAQLSALLDGRVELGHVSADWHRLNPRIEISQITLHDSRGSQVLTIPHLAAVVSWRSIWTRTPQFVSLHAGGVDLSVRRDDQHRLWLAGRSVNRQAMQVDNPEQSGALGDKAVQWLAAQPQIRLYDSTLRWVDETRGGQPLVLQDVGVKIRNRGQQHQFSLTARPDTGTAGSFDMRGNFIRSSDATRPLALESGDGRLYVHIDDMRPQDWRFWVDWPDFFHSERVSIRAWFDVGQGEPFRVTTDVQANNALWQISDTESALLGSVRLHAAGPWQAFQEGTVDFGVQVHELELSVPDHYREPVRVLALAASGSAGHQHDGVAVQLDTFGLHNDDIALQGQLEWTPASASGPGHIDARAVISRARLDAVHHYIPQGVSVDVRDWLEHGLLAGQVRDATVVLRGDVSEFPFNETGSDGEFSIRGNYHDAIIDYLPEDESNKGWPRLNALQGHIALDRASLSVHADTGQINPVDGASIQLRQVQAHIDNLRQDPILRVSGATWGDGADYMAFLQTSELNGILNHAFDLTTAQGAWQLPLELTIPLTRSIDTQVSGTLQMADGQIRFGPDYPVFDQIKGDIDFTENGVSLSSLSARFLKGNVRLSGGVGPDQPGLSMAGRVNTQAFASLLDAPGMARFDGSADYVATLSGIGKGQTTQGLTLSITSDLKGVSMDFPPPLRKEAGVSWPLEVTWSHDDKANARSLALALNHSIHARFEHADNSSDAYFDSGSLGVGRTVEHPDTGLHIDIEHPVFDADAWNAISREFTESDDQKSRVPIFPEIHSLRVQTASGRLLGLPLDQLTYTVKQLSASDWRADISSTQTAGTLTWKQESNVIQGPVQAVFHRLAYGEADKRAESASDDAGVAESADGGLDDDLRIPAINLIIENLQLYGRDVGKLALVGVNEDRGDTWRLEQFALSSPSAYLEGRGVWRLRGPRRGLFLDAEVDVSDLGDYFDQIGFKDVLSGGQGSVELEIDWHQLPWSFDPGNIDGHLGFEFTKGRFSTLNSKSARLLELISLQSVRRLATLDLNPLTLTKEGFPYDMLRGQLRLEHGRVHTEDYRITGPAGTIVLDGLVHLKTGELDLQAVVIPNLDVSGAAIAAGVAINPVVGIGAFLTQWLLKAPLAAAMTAQYKIDGDWDQPEIQAIERIKGRTDP